MVKYLGMIGLFATLFITGCEKKTIVYDKTPYDIKECTKELSKGAELHGERITKIVAFKKKRLIYAYVGEKMVMESRMSLGKNGDKGHKIQQGDYKTPHGRYRIVRKKCDKRLYRSLMISYPDAVDRARSRKLGVNPGGYITVHGQPKWNANGNGDKRTLSSDWTEGCMAVPNKIMDILWAGVKNGAPMTIYP